MAVNFSKEYLYEVNIIKNHALGIYFNPKSKAFQNYGSHVVVDLHLNDEEQNNLARNYLANINSYGNIKAKALVNPDLNVNQKAKLQIEGFNTSEIHSINFV